MESNRSDCKTNKQADRSNQSQSRSSRVEFANELSADLDKRSDKRSDKTSKSSR
jgi:hypothetical protein